MQRGFGARHKTLSVAKIYLKFKKLRAMSVGQRYKFHGAAAKYAFASLVAFKGSL